MTVWVSVRPTFSNEGTSFSLPRLEPQEIFFGRIWKYDTYSHQRRRAVVANGVATCNLLSHQEEESSSVFSILEVRAFTRRRDIPSPAPKPWYENNMATGPKAAEGSSVLAHQRKRKRKKKANRAGLCLLKKSNDISDCTPACPEPVEQWAAASSDCEYSVSKHGSSHTALRPSSPC